MSVDLIVQAKRYEVAGAAAVSVVTDATFFAGNIRSIAQVKKAIALPILHKDFIIDEYQVYESVCAGADAILLIAALLPKKEVCTLSELALRLGLAPLIEVHTHEDVVKAHATRAKLIGINVRDLKTFSVLKDRVDELVPFVSSERIRIAESGIQTHADVLKVVSIGAQAILVGTALMRAADPGVKIRELLYGY